MTDNLFAYTAPGTDYPGYVSINRTPEGDVAVTVREAPTVRENQFSEGMTVTFTVPADEWAKLG